MKTVLITGCSSGFGRELVPAFLEKGWRVIATLRGAERRRSLFERELAAFGDRLEILELDVADAASRAGAARRIEEAFGGRLDCLVNNAGIGVYGAFEDLAEEQLRRQMEVNFFGLAFLSRDLLPALRRSRGTLVNVTSVLGFAGLPLTSAYCASKFAVEGLTESLRFELRPHGVSVRLVEPGSFGTRFADNVEWAAGGQAPSSPYREQTERYRAYRASRGRASSFAPVIRAVVRAAEAGPSGRLRYPCGREPIVFHWLRRLLPERLEAWILRRVLARLFGRT